MATIAMVYTPRRHLWSVDPSLCPCLSPWLLKARWTFVNMTLSFTDSGVSERLISPIGIVESWGLEGRHVRVLGIALLKRFWGVFIEIQEEGKGNGFWKSRLFDQTSMGHFDTKSYTDYSCPLQLSYQSWIFLLSWKSSAKAPSLQGVIP